MHPRPRPTLAPLALGLLTLGTLIGCAPATSTQALPGQASSPAARTDTATVFFRSQTQRAGDVDVVLDNRTVLLRQVRASAPYRPISLPPGRRTLSVQNSLNGTLLADISVDLRAGGTYGLILAVDAVTNEYVLVLE
ncbi:hypothetical protein V3W47_02135 [Deinococcus sp. YIM 134068]|uniref:hypothetical protein n=1 Tax=Deinococcus lichenicola TaxID=3118910 RepID=UPI002F9441A5